MNWIHRRYCGSARWAGALEDKVVPWVLGATELGDDALELGPGPGLTTRLLAARARKLTAVESDVPAVRSLQAAWRGTHVDIVLGDGADMPFGDGRFSSATSFTMLHHVPSADLQDRLFGEVHRVLRPGAPFCGADSRSSLLFRAAHIHDTMVLVNPDELPSRLERAGFGDIRVESSTKMFKFSATRT